MIADGSIAFAGARESPWPSFGIMVATGFVGLCAGNACEPRVDAQMFRWILVAFLACGAALLGTSGWKDAHDASCAAIAALAGLTLAGGGAAAAAGAWRRWRRRRRGSTST